ncbi:30S ribosomal protein S6 [Mesoplasma florum L1]|uniref:Small ribosomal subunit protein bS6 n=1 Tax=Mesoplasma florum (strain ATCC 33453 / NBRC 100688 / NCTC 11704 / L1) TaxID=265311 RepID=RS6_MESFL|nr:30S ribosomal protein S6 [Mesoplasma florum]Q6F237.1 RecName: Full=Small ribosomal subunit protein bS6; AltName: Full=30S ribosomal protein S6 [Mesoplasma florum L1]AAT75436.1 30S ribosomal protein S6 [Mesoplasma florum L1]ATI73726.1 30S ribosomal protein S6 [Mesoplasma florum]
MLRKYEAMFILDQDTQDVNALSSRMIEIISKDGKVIEKNDLGLIEFAYKINHKKKGHYFVVIVEATAEAIKEFERIANIEKNVVRTLIINTENEQGYEQSVQLSKTDMTKFEEERKAKRDFKKPFVKKEFNKPTEKRTFEKPAEVTVEVKEVVVEEVKQTVKPAKKVAEAKVEEVSHEEAHDFVSKMEAKYKAHLAETVEEHVEEVEVEEAKTTAKKPAAPKMSAAERAKVDGSHNIDEERYELQKYSNKLRSVAIEKNLPKKLQEVNLRDLTKKELIEYMRKVRAALAK